MLDLFKVELPDAINVSGNLYKIKTDYKYWIRFSQCLKTGEEFSFIFIDTPPVEKFDEVTEQLMMFYNPKEELPRPVGKQSNEITLDYDIDADYIYSAFMEQYKIDLMDSKLKMHWWKFSALLKGLHNTKLNEIMSYRCYDPNDKTSYEQSMRDMKNQWRIPQPKVPLSEANKHFNDLLAKRKK